MTEQILTQEFLHKLFDYLDGHLIRKTNASSNAKVGKKAGTLRKDGYIQTSISKKLYLNHRLIFLMHHGFIPKYIDHINGNKQDNNIDNLREATHIQNMLNAKLSKANSSGVKNVQWDKRRSRWAVFMRLNGKNKTYGYFKNLQEAKNTAIEVRTNLHKEYANHGF
jgi:hypothetical protein